MFEFIPKIMEEDAQLKAVSEAIAQLKRLDVLVGVPEGGEDRKAGAASNAELVYIHTNGSPIRGIPARPIIEPAILDGKDVLGEKLSKAYETALAGNTAGVRPALEKAGQAAQNIVRDWFTNPKNNWAELKTAAEERREKKMSKSALAKAKKRAEEDKSFVVHRPLIDTGEMRKSIVYVVREI